MALPLGKLAILVGAGIVGSVLAKEGRLPSVSDIFSSALKVVNPDKAGSSHSDSKPQIDILKAQIERIKLQMEVLASNDSITIVTSSGAGREYVIFIVVVVVGYGYVRWKRWKLPDMMFATKRGLSDACNSVSRQFEDIYKSISATQSRLSSKINNVDHHVTMIGETSQATKEDVSLILGRSKMISTGVQNVRDLVQNLESKLDEIESKQDITTKSVWELCDFAWRLDNGRATELFQALLYQFSRAAVELPTGSLPTPLPLEAPSPSDSNGLQKVERPWQKAQGLSIASEWGSSLSSEFNGFSEVGEPSSSPEVSSGIQASEESNNRSPSNRLLGKLFSTSVLTRQRSATNKCA